MTNKGMSKSQFVTALAEKSGISKTQATVTLDTITEIVTQQLGPKGPGEVVVPGLLKLSFSNPTDNLPTSF